MTNLRKSTRLKIYKKINPRYSRNSDQVKKLCTNSSQNKSCLIRAKAMQIIGFQSHRTNFIRDCTLPQTKTIQVRRPYKG